MIRMLLIAGAALSAAACAATPAQTAAAADRDCFNASQITGFNMQGDRQMLVSVGASRRYQFDMFQDSRELRWDESVAIRARGSSWICTGNGLGVTVIGGDPRRTYHVDDIARLPDRHAAAAETE